MPGIQERPAGELRIAIAGGGASGTLLAIQLLRQARCGGLPARIWLIDQHGRHGLGQAYATRRDEHLLNAMAGAMSALSGDQDHLISWANATGAVAGPVSGTAFLPRRAYGTYLLDTLAAAERAAWPTARLSRITATVQAVRAQPRGGGRAAVLQTSAGKLEADVVVLATGHEPGVLPAAAPDCDAIIADPWLPGALDRVCRDSGSCRVVIAGTGLTMADVAIAVSAARPGSTVHAVSRHGLLPRTHQGGAQVPARPLWLPAIATAGPVRLTELMWQLRHVLSASPGSWQAVLEALRPHVPGLWYRLPEPDKRAFLRHAARFWEVHRHLMPPATAARITMLRQTGRLTVHRGRVLAARQLGGGLSVLTDTSAGLIELDADWLINGTGAAGEVTATASPLLRDLLASGLARPGPAQLGVDADVRGAVLSADGRPSSFLHAIGPPLRGLWYETTAIPEIREQAAALAARIISPRLVSASAAQPD